MAPSSLVFLFFVACHGIWLQSVPEGIMERMSFSGQLHSLLVEERLKKVSPIAWVHVPKTGATLTNAVLHLPGICPGIGKSDSDYLCSSINPDCQIEKFTHQTDRSKPPAFCPGISRWGNHAGFFTEYMLKRGHAFTMMRQPEQRLIAGYFNKNDHQAWDPEWGEPKDMIQYARVTGGIAVKMLSRDDSNQFDARPVQPNETEIAVKRLRDGFAFVGITEQYELSMCLLHKMFGGDCDSHDFFIGHPGTRHVNSYNTSQYLGDFRDEADNALYSEAKRIFNENLVLYDVTLETCDACFKLAGYQ